MDAPKYVVLVLLFEPQTGEGRGDQHHRRPQRGPGHRSYRRAQSRRCWAFCRGGGMRRPSPSV
jgi:hypothetical protein